MPVLSQPHERVAPREAPPRPAAAPDLPLDRLLRLPRPARTRRGLSFGLLLSLAAYSLWRNASRTLLAMLGIVIGVGCVITMMALGEGTRVLTEEQIRARGSFLLMVRPAEQRQGAVRMGAGSDYTLTLEDVEAVNKLSAVERAAPRVDRDFTVKAGSHNTRVEVLGTNADYFFVRNYTLDRGRVFGATEVRSALRVCLLGPTAARDLFLQSDPLGKTVMVRGQPFKVIGLLKPRDPDFDNRVWVPVTTAMRRLFQLRFIEAMDVRAKDEQSMRAAEEQIAVLLRKRHRLRDDQENDFQIRNQQDMLEAANETTAAIRYLLVGIASVSLVVGGIGIMNIMLVSVTARTREIGIRRAVGARMIDVVWQFLVESILMCFIGSVVGVLAGLGGCWAGATYGQWPISVTPTSIGVSCAVAVSVGLFFGLYPAIRAAKVSPLTALRYQ